MPNHFSHAPNVELVFGSYTGDGTESHAITGLGGKPKDLAIYMHPVGEGTGNKFEKLDLDWGSLALMHKPGANYHEILDNKIISLHDDGFTVSDAGLNQHPNIDGVVYDFRALI